jgi:hypothetical protein
MGQDISTPFESSSPSVSILEPLSVCVAESPVSCAQRRAQIEEEQMERVMDPELVRSIMALTEQTIETTSESMPSNNMRSTNEEEDIARMRAEAEHDFKQWKAARRRLRLGRHDSSTSTASSGFSPLSGLARGGSC